MHHEKGNFFAFRFLPADGPGGQSLPGVAHRALFGERQGDAERGAARRRNGGEDDRRTFGAARGAAAEAARATDRGHR